MAKDLSKTTAVEKYSFKANKPRKKLTNADRNAILQPQKIGTGELENETPKDRRKADRRKKKPLSQRRNEGLQPQKIGTGEVDAED